MMEAILMKNKTITEIWNEWEKTGDISKELAEIIENRLEDIIRYELNILKELVEKDKPHQAFGKLIHMLSFLNNAIIKLPSIYKSFEKWIYQIKLAVEATAKKMGAKEFNISFSMSQGIYITLSFKIK